MPGPEDPDSNKVLLEQYGSMLPDYNGLRLFKLVTRLMEILAYEDGFDYILSENTVPGT
jgi:hypothetical protein